MTVAELVAELGMYELDAEVMLMMRPCWAPDGNWPHEHDIKGVIQRKDFATDEEPDSEEFQGEPKSTDVFIVEARQVRYGDMAAWDR